MDWTPDLSAQPPSGRVSSGPGSAQPPEFRCSNTTEPAPGTAPTETRWLLVEYAGSWGHAAVEESRLGDAVKRWLAEQTDVYDFRVQLIRRHKGRTPVPITLYLADLTVGRIEVTQVQEHDELLDLDLGAWLTGEVTFAPWNRPLWLVCTNGRRDRCCAELGRPVTAALAAQWPEETWETTHLGGHRFAPTWMGLPSGLTLAHTDAEAALAAADAIHRDEFPTVSVRGRAGLPAEAQVAELHVRHEGATEVHWQPPVETDGEFTTVRLHVDGEPTTVTVRTTKSQPRRLSCGDLKTKPVPVFDVVDAGTVRGR